LGELDIIDRIGDDIEAEDDRDGVKEATAHHVAITTAFVCGGSTEIEDKDEDDPCV